LLLLALLLWIIVPYQRLMRRNMQHMDEQERLTREILEIMKRMEQGRGQARGA
jgi:hypothetical protein